MPISKSGGTLNDINPNDIESMELLKDASATAIYGTNLSLIHIFIVTQPISVMAEEIMIFAQTAQQQKQSVSGVIKDATGAVSYTHLGASGRNHFMDDYLSFS